MAIGILRPAPSMMIYQLPGGKPDPSAPFEEGAEELRPRTIQVGQKGPTDWYYSLVLLRERVGKNLPNEASDALKKKREIEQLFSDFRKAQTALSLTDTVLTKRFYYSSVGKEWFAGWEQKPPSPKDPSLAAALLKIEREIENHSVQVQRREEPWALLPPAQRLLKAFQSQNTMRTLIEFASLQVQPFEKDLQEKGMRILDYFRTTFDQMQKDERLGFSSGVNEFDSLISMVAHLAIEAYGFQISSWSPTSSIDQLQQALEEEGPLRVTGFYSEAFFMEEPIIVGWVGSHPLWEWDESKVDPDTITSGTANAIIVLGVDTENQRVFFIDPDQKSDPDRPEDTPILQISYGYFTDYIADIYGKDRVHNGITHAAYAHYHPRFSRGARMTIE